MIHTSFPAGAAKDGTIKIRKLLSYRFRWSLFFGRPNQRLGEETLGACQALWPETSREDYRKIALYTYVSQNSEEYSPFGKAKPPFE